MSKALEALKRIKNAPTIYVGCASDIYTRYSFECKEIEKSLKALEIIKEKEVNVFIFLHSGDLETYNDMVEDNRKLKKEEYDLLKGVLLWDLREK